MAYNPHADADRIMAHLNAGQFKQAFKAAKAATKAYPREAYFANLAGTAQAQMGEEREAITWFQKALKLNPAHPDAQNNLIQALISTGQAKRALDLITRLLPKRPDRANMLYFQGLAQMNAGLPDAALASLDQALSLDPRQPRTLTLRGVLRSEAGDEDGAITDYQAALALNPKAPDTLSNLSTVLGRKHRMDDALAAVEKALALSPNHIASLQRHAVVLNELGRRTDAITAYRRLLIAAPNHPEALLELALLSPAEDRPALLNTVDAALRSTPKAAPAAPFLALAKANLLMKSADGDGTDADRWFQTANEGFARQRPFDPALAQAEFAAITARFANATDLPPAAAPEQPAPVFVLGLPRSGTTLTEQILTSHPALFGCGELATAGRLVRPLLEADTDFDPTQFAQSYRAALPPMPEDTQGFIDKMPANYRYIGFLLTAFPNATILHITRDPRDVALSMWRTYFSSPAMAFTYDQRAMAAQINIYRRYMAHWQALFGGRITDISYETLVRDTENTSRTLAQACGVDWHPDMALPERNTAPVLTASVAQVREGVHDRSLGGWVRHKQALSQVIDNLDPALWPDL
ncbi:sulfotransferase [Thalassovita taeanensis]|uniref:Tfp pilus assembly protein PilF n=1 Tax=Thalassovita taeanensis TaxID=657014 RepID=A0A1H9CHA4_9RHOB|nr:sulfotransferase [Thalassovita taeanensis]SEQ00562.1 Tfp pilus assembly protein PilF [Thalassovita taeanensis]